MFEVELCYKSKRVSGTGSSAVIFRTSDEALNPRSLKRPKQIDDSVPLTIRA